MKKNQEEWDLFVEINGGDIFLSYDWCSIWWKYYGSDRKLKIFVFRSDDDLVGIIPLFFETVWLGPVCLKVVKIVGSDSSITTVNVPLMPKFMDEIIRVFADKMEMYGSWDVMCIGPISGMYDKYEQFRDCIFERISATSSPSSLTSASLNGSGIAS